jgi:DNA repair protein RadA/Sms
MSPLATTIASTPKRRTTHLCTSCGTHHAQWSGKCTGCGEWNTLAEEAGPVGTAAPLAPSARPGPTSLADVDLGVGRPSPTGIGELDRVLGGGLVPGSVTLLGGEPGIGKSTLLLQLVATWPRRTLYVTAEESTQQVRLRAERLGAVRPDVWLHAETSLPHILASVDEVRPDVLVIDSIQTVSDPNLGAAPGSVGQVRGCAARLVGLAKERGIAVILAGHVTKDGSLAGPRVLEHTVDTVLQFEGDRHHALRLLRAAKHRFGPTTELGLFEMSESGLVGVPDPSRLFLADRRTGVAGSALVPTVDGRRPLVVEVQALTSPTVPGVPPRRTAQGLDGGRLSMLMAVLDRRARIGAGTNDVYASTAGGMKITETGLDLGVCLAVASALSDLPVPGDLAAFGEVGLGGEIRQVGHAARRLSELERLGTKRVIVPANSPQGGDGVRLLRVSTLAEAIAQAGLTTR